MSALGNIAFRSSETFLLEDGRSLSIDDFVQSEIEEGLDVCVCVGGGEGGGGSGIL